MAEIINFEDFKKKKSFYRNCILKKKKIFTCFFFLFTRLCFLIHLNLNLTPTCKTDYLVFSCCFHVQIKYEEFNSNTTNLQMFCYFFLFNFYSRSPDLDKYLCKDDTHLFVNLVLVLTRKVVLFELDQSLGFAALTSSLGSSSNKISYFVRTRSN